MIQLVIRNGVVIAWHDVHQNIHNMYPRADGYEVVQWGGDLPRPAAGETVVPDPRSNVDKQRDTEERFMRQREDAYPDPLRLLLMIYNDMKNGATTFQDTIDAIHARFPNLRQATTRE